MRCLSARKSKKDAIDKESFDILSMPFLSCRPPNPEFSSPGALVAPLSARCLLLDGGNARKKESPIKTRAQKGRKKKECSEEVASQVEVVSSVEYSSSMRSSSVEQAHDALWYRTSYLL